MASEYLKWKYRDVRPDEPPPPLTPKERVANWWHYHKWHMAIGAALLFALLDIGLHVAGFGREAPDYQFAYVGSRLLPDEAVTALENALSELGADCNGDGRVLARLNQYADATVSGDADAAMYAYASNVRLMADLQRGDSAFFLLENPQEFQRNYDILSGDALSWTDCPALSALPLGGYDENLLGQEIGGDVQSLFAGLSLARRDLSAYPEEYAVLWNVLTEAAS